MTARDITPLNDVFKTLIKQVYLVLGWCLVLIGALTWILPLPIGLPLLLAGGLLLYTHSGWVRRHYRRLRSSKRYPRLRSVLAKLEKMLARLQQR
ncbi:MAG: hypothetical protein KDK05_21650 [Candidatus Competibacteraceae bacterium]|nr:hypothetical protein [Candidatus Competibacteraceae bacterium]